MGGFLREPEVTSLSRAALGAAERGPWPAPALLLVGSALLGGCVVQAHVLLAGSPAQLSPVLCRGLSRTEVATLPLLGGLGGFTRLREVLERKEKQRVSATRQAASAHLTPCCRG